MYIRNIEKIDNKRLYKCGKIVGKYLEKKGMPLISKKDNQWIFSNTKALKKVISEMPLYMSILVKVGVING